MYTRNMSDIAPSHRMNIPCIRIQNRLVYISYILIVCDNRAVAVWNSWYAVWLIATPAVRQTFAKALNIYDKQFLFMSFLSIFSVLSLKVLVFSSIMHNISKRLLYTRSV